MSRKDWINLGFFSLFVGLLSPTIQVITEAPISEWRIASYEVEYPSQVSTWIVVSAIFLICVEVGSRIVPFFDTIVANLLTWIIGGAILNIAQVEMFWLTLKAFNQEFSQRDVIDTILTQGSILNSLGLGLVVMLFSAWYRPKRMGDGNSIWLGKSDSQMKKTRNKESKEEELSQLMELISDTPPTRI